jgi:hypothetical protein
MFSDWVSFLAYLNLFEIKDFVVVVVVIFSIMEGQESLPAFSPELLVRKPSNRLAVSLLPRIVLFHGTNDCSIPSTARSVYRKRTLSVLFSF